ncbi:MAG TPA: alginate lyase family protein [Candidatus Polarisedimenticolia bacterium]|nr:alginate lyase family protein [Candidatus Polarisedimenticolia bacterium]
MFSRLVDWTSADFSWHRDVCFSNALFPALPYPLMNSTVGGGRDVSAVWEMSRLQFVPTLLAANGTGEPDTLDPFRRLVDSWIAANPRGIGPNWMNGMDVGLRGINLALGLAFYSDVLADRRDLYARVLWAHILYIVQNDIRRGHRPRNNHFLTSLAGLIVMVGLFEGAEAERILGMANRALVGEVLFQFRPDGGSFESSTHYHMVSLEGALTALLFLRAWRAAGRNAESAAWSPEALDRLRRALDLAADSVTACAASPQFGDSTFTRIFLYRDYFSWRPIDPTYLWDLADAALQGGYHPPTEIRRACYDDSGYGFFAGSRYGVGLNSNAIGSGRDPGQGHHHCDKGSLVMQIGGQPLLADSGTFCYTSDIAARFAFKRSSAHNVVIVDGEEQLEVRPEHVFGALRSASARIRHGLADGVATFVMEHDGYTRLPGLGQVVRTVRCHPDRVVIEDRIDGTGLHGVETLWHLHPDVEVREEPGGFRLRLSNGGGCRLVPPPGMQAFLEPASYSEAYGERRPSRRIRFAGRGPLPFETRCVFEVESP